AFVGYNTVFIGGNWAYVQRYTSVADTRSAKKVGYLFGTLYLISPLIWMLPPMIYRVVDPSLVGLESEGAYLMMCMNVLPVGMLGLMLGGMVFATASSVNTSLNLAAAVLTNDVYKPLYPDANASALMRVARWATLIFGLGTIGVAFLVPMAGGIVEVVLSIGAVTGGALYAPAIWGLFSKRQTGRSILTVTVISLLVNLYFKFIHPLLYGFSLNRSEEMVLGVALPLFLLGCYEVYALKKGQISAKYLYFNELKQKEQMDNDVQFGDAELQNRFGIKVIGLALISIGILFLVLGLIAEKGIFYTLLMGGGILVLGMGLLRFTNRKKSGV
ncbi:MAG: sodium transporter, partial [Cyclobacteriaceae bacterium]